MSARSIARRGFLLGGAVTALAGVTPAPPLSPDDLALAEKAATYLEGLTSAHARFVQVDPRGAVSKGEFWLQRPGKARFQYDPPSGVVVASDGRLVSILNPRLRTFQNYPLGLTPLSILLARRIRIDHGVTVTAVEQTPRGFSITAHGGGKTSQGRITLDFSAAPMALTGWTITDPQGRETRISLLDLREETGLAAKLFDIRRPQEWIQPPG